MSDPIDDMIAGIQGARPQFEKLPPPAPVPAAEPLIVASTMAKLHSIHDEIKAMGLKVSAEFSSPAVQANMLRLHYREIIGNEHHLAYVPPNKLGPWSTLLLLPVHVSGLAAMAPKARENLIIKHAVELSIIGRYPNVLFKAEWFDPTTKQIVVHELPLEGFVRG